MKKNVLVLIMLLSVSFLFAAGQEETAATGELPEVTWKLSHTQAPDNFINGTAEVLADYVAEQTDGKFTIEVYHSGTLGWEREVLESMQLGTMAMTIASASPYSEFVPGYNLYSLPGLFSSVDQLKTVYETEAIQSRFRASGAEVGLMEMGTGQYVFRDTFLNTNAVETPADLKGKKIRVMGVPILVDTYKALGANVTTTAWAELYSALQLGVVDGIDHVPAAVKSMKFYEILKYASRIPIFASPMLIVASKPLYDKLPAEYQAILQEGVDKAVEYLNTESVRQTEIAIDFLQEQGLEYSTPDPKPFLDLVKPVRDKYKADLEPWAQEVVEMIESMN